MQLHIQITQIRPDRRVPLVLNPFLLFGNFAHLVEHVCRARVPNVNTMLISNGNFKISYFQHPDSHSSSSNMAVSFLAAGANDVLVKEADACPLVKFEALSRYQITR
jgi:hypothetical protein